MLLSDAGDPRVRLPDVGRPSFPGKISMEKATSS